MDRIKLALRALVLRAARLLGSPVRDVRTGQVLGRALLVPFRGKIHVIGLETAVVPVFVPQERLTYWKQELGFTAHPRRTSPMSRVLNLLVTHQPPATVERMLAWWRNYCPPDNALVVFNGTEAAFRQIAHPQKIRVEDPRLQTRQHQRERQSYTAIFRAASYWLADRDFTHVHFAEYDQIPLVPDFNTLQVARLEEENADVLAFELLRVDGTSQPHYLYHADLPGFAEFWRKLSVRPDKTTVLSMFGSGSFWTRAAFDAVARVAEPFPVYLELWLPTVAHHLGYRVRDWREQGRFISSLGNFADRLDEARRAGAWTIHPVKSMWNGS